MRKIAFLIVLCCLMPVKSWAWRDNPAAIKAVTALFHNLTTVQKQFAEFAPQHSCHPDVYIPMAFGKYGCAPTTAKTAFYMPKPKLVD